MDDRTRQRLNENALAIEKFRDLHPTEREWLLPLLSKGIRSTLEILDLIETERLTYSEIGHLLGLSPVTVSQKLNALLHGGMALELTEATAYAPTGRPRRLATKLIH